MYSHEMLDFIDDKSKKKRREKIEGALKGARGALQRAEVELRELKITHENEIDDLAYEIIKIRERINKLADKHWAAK